MSRVAVIPARGGSRRIPGKNIREFHGRPMLAWPLRTAIDSGLFDRIIVSTDDDQVADVARNYGAEVPFTRPRELSDDHTGTGAVTRHALHWLVEHGDSPEHVCCIYPTAAFLQAGDLVAGLQQLQSGDWDFAFSAVPFSHPVQRAIAMDGQGQVAMVDPACAGVRSQDLPPRYHDAGQFYWGTASAWDEHRSVFHARSCAVLLPNWRVQDIDTPDDWRRAELIFHVLQQSGY